METIKHAIRIVGLAKLARTVGVSQQAVCLWRQGGTQILAKYAAAIEDATNGSVTAKAIGDESARIQPKANGQGKTRARKPANPLIESDPA